MHSKARFVNCLSDHKMSLLGRGEFARHPLEPVNLNIHNKLVETI